MYWFLNVNKSIQCKLHTIMKCPFLALFYFVCAYGPILITSKVLNPFSPFFQQFIFQSLKVMLWLLKEDFDYFFPCLVHFQYFEDNNTFYLWMLISHQDNMFITFHVSTNICVAYMWLLYYWCMDYYQLLYSYLDS